MRTQYGGPAGFQFLSGAPNVMDSYHQHMDVEINLLVAGEMTYLLGGARQVIKAGQLIVFWATMPHQVVDRQPETLFYCIHLPLSQLLQWRLPQEFTHRLLHGEIMRERDVGHAAEDRLMFARWHKDARVAPEEWQALLLLEMEARLRRLARGIIADYSPPALHRADANSSGILTDKIERMTAYIAAHYQSSLAVSQIAAAVDLHPKYAMALFRKECGLTIGEFVTRQRLAHAQRLLATSDRKVIDVAFESGFGSISQFYAIFRRYCGQYPKEYRVNLALSTDHT